VLRQYCFLCIAIMSASGCVSPQSRLISTLQADNETLVRQLESVNKERALLQANEKVLSLKVEECEKRIGELIKKSDLLKKQNHKLIRVITAKDEQRNSLEKARAVLAENLKSEIEKYQARLEMTENGLVVSFIAEILFDSGKAEIKEEGYQVLRKIAEILNSELKDNCVAIEGHTDNDPITYSAWGSNWELSSARSLSVVNYFIEEFDVDPSKLSSNAYGEHRPRIHNNNDEGKRQNRRVEINIFPKLERQKFG